MGSWPGTRQSLVPSWAWGLLGRNRCPSLCWSRVYWLPGCLLTPRMWGVESPWPEGELSGQLRCPGSSCGGCTWQGEGGAGEYAHNCPLPIPAHPSRDATLSFLFTPPLSPHAPSSHSPPPILLVLPHTIHPQQDNSTCTSVSTLYTPGSLLKAGVSSAFSVEASVMLSGGTRFCSFAFYFFKILNLW